MAIMQEAWQASFVRPIAVAGDRPHLSGRRECRDGHTWLWAANDAGVEGWVPDSLPSANTGRARSAFDAAELSCALGETLKLLHETHGWAWCENAKGRKGWVPLNCLKKQGQRAPLFILAQIPAPQASNPPRHRRGPPSRKIFVKNFR